MMATPALTGNKYILPFTPRGAAREIFMRQDPELVLSGPAGTGKSRTILEKVHLACLKHAGLRALMLRKTRRSLTESGMVTYWDKIRPDLDGVQWKSSVQQYQYRRNGAVLAVGGLDRPSKIMSSEWDLIYVQEATELTEDDWEACTVRLRNGKNSYHQLIGDCNPDTPTHWLRQRANDGRTVMLESRHEDNPVLFDEHGVITPEGQRYMEVLDSLSGVRLARYRFGLWAAASGTVYEQDWDRAKNVVDRFPIPREWQRVLAIDFGYVHPFVCLWAAIDPDGRIYVYRQLYKTKTLVEDHALTIAIASGWYHLLPRDHEKFRMHPADWADPLPRDIICDHDQEDRRTLERHLKLYTVPAKKTVRDGIQAVASRFRLSGDGKPRLMIVRDSVIERDQELARMKRPTCVEEEPDGYVWKKGADQNEKEEPVKEADDGLDALRYLVAYFDLQPGGVTTFKSPWR